LVRKRDRIVRKDDLIDSIWQGRIVSEATLSSRISAARRALGDSGNDQNLIRTIHKRGFRFVGEVEEIEADDDVPAKMTGEPPVVIDGALHGPRAVDKPPPTGRHPIFVSAVIGFAALFVAAGWWLLRAPAPSATVQAMALVTPSTAAANSTDLFQTPVPPIAVPPS